LTTKIFTEKFINGLWDIQHFGSIEDNSSKFLYPIMLIWGAGLPHNGRLLGLLQAQEGVWEKISIAKALAVRGNESCEGGGPARVFSMCLYEFP